MDDPFSNRTGQELLTLVRKIFEDKPIFRKESKPLVFLCGGAVSSRSKNIRTQFLAWAKTRLPGIVFVLAENAYGYTKLYEPPEAVNLSEFEQVIAQVADCVLLFPESAGSFAELGLFSGCEEICRKILVANPVKYVADESFVNRGPVDTINAWSYLTPSLPITFNKKRPNFAPVRLRLQRVVQNQRRKSFKFRQYRELDISSKFLVVLEMINIFQIVRLEDIENCIRWAFGSANRKELRPILSVLLGTKFVTSHDDYYVMGPSGFSLLEFEDVQIEDIRTKILSHYQKNYPRLWQRYLRITK
jgi:hypothetical protein